jgi:hypothetical protein
MPEFGDSDLNAMLGEPFGKPLTAAGQSDWGVLTQSSEIILAGTVIHLGPSVLAKRSLFGGLTYGSSLSIGGNVYRVEHEPITGGDGALCRIPLTLLGVLAPAVAIYQLVTADGGRPLATGEGGKLLQTQAI